MFLNEAVEHKSFKSVSSSQARGVAIRLVLGTTKSQLLNERSDDREGMLEAGVNRLAM